MKTNLQYVRDKLYDRLNFVDTKAGNKTYEELCKTEWSPKFEKLMRNRLIMGAIRYCCLHSEEKTANNYYIESIIERAKLYKQNGNTEYLVDIANLALLEFEDGNHPNKHFESIDDDIHVQE